MSHEKFKSRNIDPDTDIIEHEVFFDEIPAMMELWSWSRYTGSSVVFDQKDIGEMSDDQLIDFVFKHLNQPIDPNTSIKRGDEFVFVNYGVKTMG